MHGVQNTEESCFWLSCVKRYVQHINGQNFFAATLVSHGKLENVQIFF